MCNQSVNLIPAVCESARQPREEQIACLFKHNCCKSPGRKLRGFGDTAAVMTLLRDSALTISHSCRGPPTQKDVLGGFYFNSRMYECKVTRFCEDL